MFIKIERFNKDPTKNDTEMKRMAGNSKKITMIASK